MPADSYAGNLGWLDQRVALVAKSGPNLRPISPNHVHPPSSHEPQMTGAQGRPLAPKKWAGAVLLVTVVVAGPGVGGCGSTLDDLFCDHATCAFSQGEWGRITSLSPIPAVSADASNRSTENPCAE